MDSKTIIAFGLMILIYFFFLAPKPPTSSPIAPTTKTETTTPAAKEGLAVKETAKEPASLKGVQPMAKVRAERMTMTNSDADYELDGLGSVVRAKFKQFREKVGSDKQVEFTYKDETLNESILRVGDAFPDWRLVKSSPTEVILEAQYQKVDIQRRILLAENSYYFQFTDTIANHGPSTVKADLKLQLFHPKPLETGPTSTIGRILMPNSDVHESVALIDGSAERHPVASIGTPIEISENLSWAGFGSKYFYFGFVPKTMSLTQLKILNKDPLGSLQELRVTEKEIPPNESSSYEYSFYVGPKEIDQLEKVSPDLGKAIDYGNWIGPIARFLLSVLHVFHKIIPNYGIGIILLTIFVKLALFPLAFKSAVSMRRLQLVQPKMKEIRDRYKDDKHRLNSELMALYRTEKVNPVGGCLPLLLQMPVFFALYRVFFASIELRHAPFFGWITDLSVHDPYFVTPILMTALMWWQQKLTPIPPTAEESEAMQMQKQMMKWMPIVFGAIMIFLPAGLTLYFLVNALISVAQQVYFNRHFDLKYPLQQESLAVKKA